jgi:hypothetical protein
MYHALFNVFHCNNDGFDFPSELCLFTTDADSLGNWRLIIKPYISSFVR